MTDINLLTIASALVATLFGLLMLILGWLGNKLYDKVSDLHDAMNQIENVLHKRISDLDRRLAVVEVKCNLHHEVIQ